MTTGLTRFAALGGVMIGHLFPRSSAVKWHERQHVEYCSAE